MLVLTRKIGESFRIGDDIEIVITGVERNKVKVGIRSPSHISVYRSELYERILEENRQAAQAGEKDMHAVLTAVSSGTALPRPDDTEAQLSKEGDHADSH